MHGRSRGAGSGVPGETEPVTGAAADAHALFEHRAAVGGANVARVVRVDAASRRMLRARDKMDRSYDKPLDVAALARVALTSEAHFIRTFKRTFGETPP